MNHYQDTPGCNVILMFESQTVRNIGDLNVECVPRRLQLDDCSVLRKAFLQARDLLMADCTKVHFSCVRTDCHVKLRLLCAQPTVLSRSECLMDAFSPSRGHSTEHGALLAVGTGCTGPVLEFFYCQSQEGRPAPPRPLRRRHLIQFFVDDLVDWIGPRGKRERFRISHVSLPPCLQCLPVKCFSVRYDMAVSETLNPKPFRCTKQPELQKGLMA